MDSEHGREAITTYNFCCILNIRFIKTVIKSDLILNSTKRSEYLRTSEKHTTKQTTSLICKWRRIVEVTWK